MTETETRPETAAEAGGEPTEEEAEDEAERERVEELARQQREQEESEAQFEQQRKQADAALKRYHTAIERIFGTLEGWETCMVCGGNGLVPPGQIAQPTYQQDPDTERCERCQGLGRMLTGSLVPGSESVNCTGCSGSGFTYKRAPTPEPPTVPPAPQGFYWSNGSLLPLPQAPQ